MCTIQILDYCMRKVGLRDTLRRGLVRYTKKRGVERMKDKVWGESNKFCRLVKLIFVIRRRRCMEGMISREVLEIQAEYAAVGEGSMSVNSWSKGLTIKLL